MKVPIRIRGPNGQARLDVEEETTLKDLIELIKEKSEVNRFSLKYGYPLVELKTDADALTSTVSDLKLKGETIVVVPHESATASATAQGAQKSADVQPAPKPFTAKKMEVDEPFTAKKMEVDETVVEWPERGGYLVLRIMPDDNSCMFTSVGGAIPIADPSGILRKEIAEYILNHPEEYTKAILGDEPSRYVRRMKEKDTWGGAIELSILSDIYKIQICSVDVKSLRIDKFGENMDTRCIVLYSGIHYDRIAFTMDLSHPSEFDVTQWSTDDDDVLAKAVQLAEKLNRMHYYTDTTDFVIKCTVCNWIGQGTKDAAAHEKEVGHSQFVEMAIQ